MKTPNKKLDEKLGKQDKPENENKGFDKKEQPSKEDLSTKQYPKKVDYHGTDDEKTLSPEE